MRENVKNPNVYKSAHINNQINYDLLTPWNICSGIKKNIFKDINGYGKSHVFKGY